MQSNIMAAYSVENLQIVISKDRKFSGKFAANTTTERIKHLLKTRNELRMIFAAAPSQDEFLEELTNDTSIEWDRIHAFHMDEYVGLPADSEQLFSQYLTRHLFSKVDFKTVNIINSQAADMEAECNRYSNLLAEAPIDIVCMGIGENGHIAFNDPPVADFDDKALVKIVELDMACKQQQVNDGCFASIADVPLTAVSLTVPMLMSGKHLAVIVPGILKAQAVYNTLNNDISEKCPATILRTHSDAILYLDGDSSSKLNLQ